VINPSVSGLIYISVPDTIFRHLSGEKKNSVFILSLFSFRFLTLTKTGMLPL
jgi:hypothetical protein